MFSPTFITRLTISPTFMPFQIYHVIKANVGTEGAKEKFPFWEFFRRADRFPHNSLSSGLITSKISPIFKNNPSAISDRATFIK
jgi:hypothetical protein